jgi:hypothetical protein
MYSLKNVVHNYNILGKVLLICEDLGEILFLLIICYLHLHILKMEVARSYITTLRYNADDHDLNLSHRENLYSSFGNNLFTLTIDI